eukprot:GHVP01031309.1.p1 GENE.GHVP01031309.1~~GHVP01031309.1.p1  ORF type:complete len:944 (+),score=153.41 GHVP01031309.1:896-3727(+)
MTNIPRLHFTHLNDRPQDEDKLSTTRLNVEEFLMSKTIGSFTDRHEKVPTFSKRLDNEQSAPDTPILKNMAHARIKSINLEQEDDVLTLPQSARPHYDIENKLKSFRVPSLDNLENEETYEQKSREVFEVIPECMKKPARHTIDSFNTLAVIGQGGYAVVRLVSHKVTKEVFALKQLAKCDLYPSIQRMIINEIEVMSSSSPWVAKVHDAWQDENFVYMLMEYLPGGDLMKHLIDLHVFSETMTRFYMTQLVSAVAHVHEELSCCHRDIKPDNILLDTNGHIKLVDFGLSKKIKSLPREPMTSRLPRSNFLTSRAPLPRELLKSPVGTADYMAPEVHMGIPYDRSIDWWGVGIIMYEMLFGGPPLSDPNHRPQKTAKRVKNWKKYLQFPLQPRVSVSAKDLISKLITSPEHRLNNFQSISRHAWFKGVDWESVRRQKAPMVPSVRHSSDYQNFDEFPPNTLRLFEAEKTKVRPCSIIVHSSIPFRSRSRKGHETRELSFKSSKKNLLKSEAKDEKKDLQAKSDFPPLTKLSPSLEPLQPIKECTVSSGPQSPLFDKYEKEQQSNYPSTVATEVSTDASYASLCPCNEGQSPTFKTELVVSKKPIFVPMSDGLHSNGSKKIPPAISKLDFSLLRERKASEESNKNVKVNQELEENCKMSKPTDSPNWRSGVMTNLRQTKLPNAADLNDRSFDKRQALTARLSTRTYDFIDQKGPSFLTRKPNIQPTSRPVYQNAFVNQTTFHKSGSDHLGPSNRQPVVYSPPQTVVGTPTIRSSPLKDPVAYSYASPKTPTSQRFQNFTLSPKMKQKYGPALLTYASKSTTPRTTYVQQQPATPISPRYSSGALTARYTNLDQTPRTSPPIQLRYSKFSSTPDARLRSNQTTTGLTRKAAGIPPLPQLELPKLVNAGIASPSYYAYDSNRSLRQRKTEVSKFAAVLGETRREER